MHNIKKGGSTRNSLVLAGFVVPMTMILVPSLRQWWCAPVLYLVVVTITMAYWQKQMNYKLRAFPKPWAIPILGHLHILLSPREKLFPLVRSLRKKHGSRFIFHVLNEYAVNISDPEAVQAVLSCPRNITKSSYYDLMIPWLGNGLLTSTGQHWAYHRKLLRPAFHFSILEKFSTRIHHHAELFAESVEREMKRDPSGSVKLMPFITKSTLDVIMEVAMGVNLVDAGENYINAVHTLGVLLFQRSSRFWLWNEFLYRLLPCGRRYQKIIDYLHGFSNKVIAKRKEFLASRPADFTESDEDEVGIRKKIAFLDVLLTAQRNGANLTDEDIRSEVVTFTFEGHDAAALAIYWIFHLIADHPEIQERLRDELRPANVKDVLTSPYLDLVVREALRLYPSVPFISREVIHPLKLGENQVLVPPMCVHIHIYDLHRDSKNFPEPNKFDPEREYPKHPFAYVPFSGGSRNCIGQKLAIMELKLFVAATLRRLRFKKPPISYDEIPIPVDLVLRPGILIKHPLEPVEN